MWVHTLFLILFFTILLLATGLVWCLLCVLLFLYCMRIPVQSDSDSKAVAWLRFTYSSGALRLQLESEMSGAIPETRVAHINCGENGGETRTAAAHQWINLWHQSSGEHTRWTFVWCSSASFCQRAVSAQCWAAGGSDTSSSTTMESLWIWSERWWVELFFFLQFVLLLIERGGIFVLRRLQFWF